MFYRFRTANLSFFAPHIQDYEIKLDKTRRVAFSHQFYSALTFFLTFIYDRFTTHLYFSNPLQIRMNFFDILDLISLFFS